MDANIAERIIKIRKSYKMTQTEFAARLNATRPKIAAYELAKVNFDPSFLSFISKEFSINEKWLMTGEGDMYTEVLQSEIDRLAERYNLSPLAKKIVKTFVALEENEMNILLNFVKEIASENNEPSLTEENGNADI